MKILSASLKLASLALLLSFFAACKEKKKKTINEKLFPVLSYIRSQAAQIDTSLYAIRKFVYIDSLRTDTIHIHRDQFTTEAADFLSLPDIASPEYEDRFQETNRFDETLQKVILTQSPVNAEKELVQLEEILIKPDPSGDKVTDIIINTSINNKDSSVEKRMLWNIDHGFQVITTRQLAGQAETVSRYRVVWNENEYE